MMETGISLTEIDCHSLAVMLVFMRLVEFRLQRVELRRRNNADSQSGIYRCDIPTVAVHHETDTSV